jgi:arylsulfatase A-like enzyme
MFIRDEKLAPWPRTKAEIRHHLRDYYGMITHFDEQIGRILKTLRDLGQLDSTLIVFSSDQGIAIGSHGLMGKQNLYEHSMGVPLIFAGPGIPQGKAVDAFAYGFDVFPTVCDLAGAPVPEGLDGKSLAPILRGEAESVRDTIFLGYKGLQRAVRRGRWKLIRYPRVNVTQLFDLAADPHETNNIAVSHPAKAKEMLAHLAAEQKRFRDACALTAPSVTPGKVDLDFFKNPPPNRKKPRKGKAGKL